MWQETKIFTQKEYQVMLILIMVLGYPVKIDQVQVLVQAIMMK